MFSARVLLYELQHHCVTRSSVTNNNTNEKKNIFENEHKSLTLCVQFAKLLIRQEFAIVLKVCVCVRICGKREKCCQRRLKIH